MTAPAAAWSITGLGFGPYARLVHELSRRRLLAASCCDAAGDWTVGAALADQEQLLWLLRQLGGFEGCAVARGGLLAFQAARLRRTKRGGVPEDDRFVV